MKTVFVDTSALIALGNKRDNFYHKAMNIRRELVKNQVEFVTTNLVVVELCNAFSGVRLRQNAIETVEGIYKSDKWKYIEADKQLMQQGFDLFKKMKDKEWGLVDCVSIVIARQLGLSEIFTHDHHFEQAGFTTLLK